MKLFHHIDINIYIERERLRRIMQSSWDYILFGSVKSLGWNRKLQVALSVYIVCFLFPFLFSFCRIRFMLTDSWHGENL